MFCSLIAKLKSINGTLQCSQYYSECKKEKSGENLYPRLSFHFDRWLLILLSLLTMSGSFAYKCHCILPCQIKMWRKFFFSMWIYRVQIFHFYTTTTFSFFPLLLLMIILRYIWQGSSIVDYHHILSLWLFFFFVVHILNWKQKKEKIKSIHIGMSQIGLVIMFFCCYYLVASGKDRTVYS